MRRTEFHGSFPKNAWRTFGNCGAIFLLMGIPQRACGGVFFWENAHGRRGVGLHPQENCSSRFAGDPNGGIRAWAARRGRRTRPGRRAVRSVLTAGRFSCPLFCPPRRHGRLKSGIDGRQSHDSHRESEPRARQLARVHGITFNLASSM